MGRAASDSEDAVVEHDDGVAVTDDAQHFLPDAESADRWGIAPQRDHSPDHAAGSQAGRNRLSQHGEAGCVGRMGMRHTKHVGPMAINVQMRGGIN